NLSTTPEPSVRHHHLESPHPQQHYPYMAGPPDQLCLPSATTTRVRAEHTSVLDATRQEDETSVQSPGKCKNLSETMGHFGCHKPSGQNPHTNHNCKRKCATTERHAAKWRSTDISHSNLPASNPREPGANPGEMG